MANVISALTGAKSSTVILGPTPGVDVSVLQVDRSRVMVVSCDPVSLIPSIGAEASARMSVYEVASDVATSGNSPKYAVVDLNLPPQISDQTLSRYWRSFSDTCDSLGLTIVGGHTGRFEGCDYSVIGGATLWTICGKSEYVTSQMAHNGDDVILTKSAAYGATAVLTTAFPRTVRKAIGSKLFEKARKYFSQSNTLRDSTTAAKAGIHNNGVTAMHDATEGGVVAALSELASASNLGGTVFLDDIPLSEETRQLCKFFRIDPLTSLGEGSLAIACRPNQTKRVMANLRSNGIHSTIVARLSSRQRGLRGITGKGEVRIKPPAGDPYWKAYWKSVRNGWS